MAKELLPDELWESIEPLLPPPEPPKPKGGGVGPVSITGPRSERHIIYRPQKRHTPWQMLPQKRWAVALWSSYALWRRSCEWQEEAGVVWERLCTKCFRSVLAKPTR